ncbi:MAG: pyridoxamine kinase [Bacteroidetes bacterium]|nr:MAG: pyridoxamine kinase [Bacteroidota bacterium]
MVNPVKKVAAIHDLSGVGRASLTVVIPILSTMGIQVCPLPTAVLSTHSKFSDYHFVDLTEHMQPIINHWQNLELKFDAIYSGFLGSDKQIDIVKNFIDNFRQDNQLVVVDPVLGDNGSLYGPFNNYMIEKMRELIKKAVIITPNLTEAAFLLDKPFSFEISQDEIKTWVKKLADMGPEIVIITSAPEKLSHKQTSVIAYNKKDDRLWKVTCDYLPASYPGTGDAFASVIVGSLLQGDSLPIALDRAVQFISMGVRATFGYNYNTNYGILLEKVLPNLQSPVQISSYELLD